MSVECKVFWAEGEKTTEEIVVDGGIGHSNDNGGKLLLTVSVKTPKGEQVGEIYCACDFHHTKTDVSLPIYTGAIRTLVDECNIEIKKEYPTAFLRKNTNDKSFLQEYESIVSWLS
ncbi:MAG TPA: hypothetical protein VG603_03915 [Chitinophagales bacterium]|nr:hypothetical protein [Chitinophagales bacterium]